MKNCPYVLYRSDRRKIENLKKKKAKLELASDFSFAQYTLPT